LGYGRKEYLTPCEPDVRVFASPGTEGFQLAFGLTHPCIEEVELAQSCCAGLGVAVDRVEANVIAMVTSSHVKKKGTLTAYDARQNKLHCVFWPCRSGYCGGKATVSLVL
jgi:hypothetical protein